MCHCTLFRIRRDLHTRSFLAREHVHEYDELTYFIRGEGTTTIKGRKYAYHANTFAYYHAKTPHDEDDPIPTDVIWLHIKHDLPGISLREGVTDDRGEVLKPILIKLLRRVHEADPWREILVESCLSEALVTAAKLQSSSGGNHADWEEIVEQIDEHCVEELDLPALASRYHYSYDRFRHLFKARFGVSPHAYLMKRRIDHAEFLLLHTKGTMTDIALDCGFSSPAHFSTVFRRVKGRSPREYRSEEQESQRRSP